MAAGILIIGAPAECQPGGIDDYDMNGMAWGEYIHAYATLKSRLFLIGNIL